MKILGNLNLIVYMLLDMNLVCCIYHKPHAEESESSDTCTSDDEINAIERDK